MIRLTLTLASVLLLAACAGITAQTSQSSAPCMCHASGTCSCCQKGECKHCDSCKCCSKHMTGSASEKPCKVCEESEKASEAAKK